MVDKPGRYQPKIRRSRLIGTRLLRRPDPHISLVVAAGSAAAAGKDGLASTEPTVGICGIALEFGRLGAGPIAAACQAWAREGWRQKQKVLSTNTSESGSSVCLTLNVKGPAREHEEHALGAASVGRNGEGLALVVGECHSGHGVCIKVRVVRGFAA